jgi:hypothetical protein
VSSSGALGQGSALSPELDVVIDYEDYSYVLNWQPRELGSDMQICGFRVYYEYTWGVSFLPNVTKGN